MMRSRGTSAAYSTCDGCARWSPTAVWIARSCLRTPGETGSARSKHCSAGASPARPCSTSIDPVRVTPQPESELPQDPPQGESGLRKVRADLTQMTHSPYGARLLGVRL